MDEIGEYHAKWDKPISKNQRTNDFADKWMITHNGGWGVSVRVRVRVRFRVRDKEGGTNVGRKECIEGKEGWEGCGGREKITEWIKQHYPM